MEIPLASNGKALLQLFDFRYCLPLTHEKDYVERWICQTVLYLWELLCSKELKTCISTWTSCTFSVMIYKSLSFCGLLFTNTDLQFKSTKMLLNCKTANQNLKRNWLSVTDILFFSSIFIYSVDQVLLLSSWQLPSFWKVSCSSLLQAVMSNIVWLECQASQKNTRIMKLASCCFFGNSFFFAGHQLW